MHLLLIALAACCLGQTASKAYTYRGARMAATVHTWTNGDEDGDWNNINNWNTGAVPGSGGASVDTAIFDGDLTQVGPSVNLDRGGDVTLYRLVVRDNFTGDIGANGNPLIHKFATVTNGYLLHRGTGAVHYIVEFGQGALAIMDGPGTLFLDCEATATIDGLFIKRGTVTAASTCQLLNEVVLDGAGASLTVAAQAGSEATPEWIIIRNGEYTNHRAVEGTDHVILFGGKLTQYGLISDSAVIVIGPSGRCQYVPSGTVGAAYNPSLIICGLLDTRDSNQDILPARLIVSQLGQVLGTAVQPGYATLIDIDLREEYP